MVIRNLLMRLGLEPDSPQLRVIGTSASLAGRGRRAALPAGVLRRSRRRASHVVPGETRALGEPVAARPRRHAGRPGQGQPPVPAVELSRAVALACWDDSEERFRATPLGDISQRLFGDDDDGAGTRAVLETIAAADSALGTVPLRAHLFARMVRGMWACANPACVGVPVADRERPHRAGACWPFPRRPAPTAGRGCSSCCTATNAATSASADMSSNALEDGGFVLGPTAPDIPALEAQPISRRRYGEYMWYWPGKRPPSSTTPAGPRRLPNGKQATFSFRPVELDPALGMLIPVGYATGWYLRSP